MQDNVYEESDEINFSIYDIEYLFSPFTSVFNCDIVNLFSIGVMDGIIYLLRQENVYHIYFINLNNFVCRKL